MSFSYRYNFLQSYQYLVTKQIFCQNYCVRGHNFVLTIFRQ
nr:MAG TPA: hypothetical protein [Caudoviricetes sp.]